MEERRGPVRAALSRAATALALILAGGVLLGAVQVTCETPPGFEPRGGVSGDGIAVVFRTIPRAIAVGQHFTLETVVCAAGAPPTLTRVDADMPEHRHGMNYRPTLAGKGAGRYVAEGFLFHIPWRRRAIRATRCRAIPRRSPSAIASSSIRGCRSTAPSRARPATSPRAGGRMAGRARPASLTSTATHRRSSTPRSTAGSRGTAAPIACGRRASSRSSIRARWAPRAGTSRRSCAATRRSPVCTRRRSARPRGSSPSARWCTAPYMHDGRYATLREAVRHYSELDMERIHTHGEQLLRPLKLSPGEIDDLVAFLESLTDPAATRVPPPPPAVEGCR